MRIIKPLPGTLPVPVHNIDGDWPMSSLGDKIFDMSGFGNHGTLAGNTHWVQNRLKFNGAGDFVACGSGINFTGVNSFTVIAWFNTTFIGYDPYIMGTGANNGWYLRLESTVPNGRVVVKVDDGSDDAYVFSTVGGYNDGKLHQLCLVWNSSINTIEGFVDCVSFGTDFQLNIGNMLNPLRIGGEPEAFQCFTGLIDKALIYNRALFTSEIARLYREPFYRYPESRIFPAA